MFKKINFVPVVFASILITSFLGFLAIFTYVDLQKQWRQETIEQINQIKLLVEKFDRPPNFSYIDMDDDAFGRPIKMKFLNDETFVIVSSAEDGIFDTGDDIVRKGHKTK